MDEIGWLFNSDFEQNLFNDDIVNLKSTKMTQEFEYLIYLLEPDKTIFTNKKYDNSYLGYIESITGRKFKTQAQVKQVIPWCNDYKNPKILKKFQLKENTIKFLVDNNLTSEDISFVSKKSELIEGFIYKYSKSMSGRGHYKYPKDKLKIEKLLDSNEILIQEKLHNRTVDFSTLVLNNQIICTYENCIDQQFQYKGSIIESNFKLPLEIIQIYQEAVSRILEYTKDYSEVFSIDSYLYNDQDSLKVFPGCELNMRKTMGFIAYELKKKYFPQSEIFKLLLVSNKSHKITYSDCIQIFGEELIILSPLNNRFLVFGICADSRKDLLFKEKKLVSAFF